MECSVPKVSVVIPLFNKQPVLQATLAGVLAQSFRQFELIVVDDGSTDDGCSLVDSLADPRVRLIRQPNQGSSVARNRGVLEARGRWIAFIDADDLWAPQHLERLVSAIAEPGFIGAFSNVVYASDGRTAVPRSIRSQRVDDYFRFALAANGYAISSSSVLVDRQRLIDCGLFAAGEQVGEDIDMWCRLAVRGPFQYVADPSATYRDNLESGALTRHLKRRVPYPPGVRRLYALMSAGEVPAGLLASARRYANFLLLEYARQLLDRGDYIRAREVLRDCTLRYDSKRYIKRFVRTFPPGRWGYRLIRRIASQRPAAFSIVSGIFFS